MKDIFYFLSVFGAIVIFSVSAYQPVEYDGLVGALLTSVPAYKYRTPSINYELRENNSASRVVIINNFVDFDHCVLARSRIKPAILFIHPKHDANTKKMKSMIVELADDFVDTTCFASMELVIDDGSTGFHDSDNAEIVKQIMEQAGLVRLELPVMLFFKDGKLYAPLHELPVVLQGICSKEKLKALIKSKNFAIQQPILKQTLYDTGSTTHGRVLPKSPKKAQPSLMQRIINFFMMKKGM